jgi:hypothetical protein
MPLIHKDSLLTFKSRNRWLARGKSPRYDQKENEMTKKQFEDFREILDAIDDADRAVDIDIAPATALEKVRQLVIKHFEEYCDED